MGKCKDFMLKALEDAQLELEQTEQALLIAKQKRSDLILEIESLEVLIKALPA